MSVLAALFVAVGVTDLVRGRGRARHAAALATGPVVVAAVAALAGLTGAATLVLLAVAAATVAGWVITSDRAQRLGRGEGLALATLGIGIALPLLAAGATAPAGGLIADYLRASPFDGLQQATPDRFLLVTGLLLVQVATGNELVRLVLATVGAIRPAGQPQASDRLRGGRLLGPLERLFLLGLGVAGEITAAGLVIAAKGLIRFPELSARRGDWATTGIGIDEVTEYFLVGSFVSWLISLASVALVALS